MLEVFKVPHDVDLRDFTRALWQLKINHRVLFEQAQILVVDDPRNAQRVLEMFNYWQQHGKLSDQVMADLSVLKQADSKDKKSSLEHIMQLPVVFLLLLSSAGLSLWVDFGENIEALRYLTVTDFVNEGNRLKYTSIDYNFESMQLWRFISPIFVHFNLTHIVFNSLWIWIVGSVIERQHRSIALLLIVLFSGIASNVAQFIVSGPIFGGLSGVVYAIIGYAWLWDKLRSDKLSVVSNALMMFMIFWLVLGYSGLLSQLGFGNMANTAHLVGLISGLLCVPSIILIKKISSA